MNNVKITLNKNQVLQLFGFIFSTTAPNAGAYKNLNNILDKLAALGVLPSEDGRMVYLDKKEDSFTLEFNIFQLDSIKYALSLRLLPNPQNDLAVNMGVARQVVWPLAKAIGIEDALRKSLPDQTPKEPDIKLDSEIQSKTVAELASKHE